MDLKFWLNFIYFFIAIFLSWYIPGRVILGRVKFESKLAIFTLSTLIGLTAWGWQAYLFGYLNLRILTNFYLLFFLTFYLKRRNQFFSELRISLKNIDPFFVLILLLGIFSQNLMTWGSGLAYPDGIRFFQINALDGVMHIAYINQIIKSIPPIEPGLSGEIIRNYHYWSNMVIAEIDRIFNIPVLNSFFQYSNFFLSLFLGLSAYFSMLIFNGNKIAARWFVFLLMLGGDFGYLVMLLLGKGLNFNITTIDNGAYFLQNPPRAYSVIIVLGGLMAFFNWLKSKNLKWGILTAVLFSGAIGFKVYSSFLVLSGLGFMSIYLLFTKNIKMLYVFPLSIILFLIIYLPNNYGAGGLIFSPLEWPINFLTQGQLGLGEWELRRQTYIREFNTKRILQMEIMMAGLFLFSQLGIKLIGFLQSKKNILKIGVDRTIFFFSGIITCLFCGLFFIQKSGNFNIFNFFLAAGVFLSFLTALFLANIKEKTKPLGYLVIVLIVVIIVLPRIIYENINIITQYRQNKSLLVSSEELKALEFLKNNTDKNALILVDNKGTTDGMTPFISFFTNRPMFLSGQYEMAAHDIDFSRRQKIAEEILNEKSSLNTKILLADNNINYLYIPSGKPTSIFKELGLSVVFANSTATIFKIP